MNNNKKLTKNNLKEIALNKIKYFYENTLKPYSNPLILEPKRGETNVIIVYGDREGAGIGGKTTTALRIVYERYRDFNEKFIMVFRLEKNTKRVRSLFKNFGWLCRGKDVLDPNNNYEQVGFLAAINTSDDDREAGYRFFNITTMIFEEMIPEHGQILPNTGKRISSIISSAFGDEKLSKNWKENKILILFFTNNNSNNHPVFYIYGINNRTEFGIEYKNNKEIAVISLVNKNRKFDEIHPLLRMGGYDKQAYGKSLLLQDDILIAIDFKIDNWKFMLNIKCFDEYGAIYKKENKLLIHEGKNEKSNEVIVIGSEYSSEKIHYGLLRKLDTLYQSNSLVFSDWKWKQLLLDTIEKNFRIYTRNDLKSFK